MIDKIKPHLFTIAVIVFVLFSILKPSKPTTFERWAYIAKDKNSTKWERVIAYLDSELTDVGHEENVRVYTIYAIKQPDSGKMFDANAQFTDKLKTNEAYRISVFGLYENKWNYIRITDEEVN